MKVVIAGAGIGGLCLAQGLRQAGLDVQVLERRSSPAGQPASYGIHLNTDGLRALRACLPGPGWDQLIAWSAPAPDVIRFRDQRLRPLAEIDREADGARPEPRRRAVSRGALRDVLLRGFNTTTAGRGDIVQWGRTVTGYQHDSDGRLRVRCADGSRFDADLLVAADGSNSRIRSQRLPGLNRIELGILNVAGRAPLTPELAAQFPETLTDGSVNNIVPSRPGWMFASTWPAGTSGADAASGTGLFLVWAFAASRGSYPDGFDDLGPERLRDYIAARISSWAPALRHLVAATDPATIAPVPLRTMPALTPWEPSDVTLLGDAIHNMTPMAGIGANTALRDAERLRQVLVSSGRDGLTARVAAYEADMRGYANRALALSTRNARGAAADGRLPRMAFRSALRVAEAVPAVKRRMFATVPSRGSGARRAGCG